MKYVLVLYTIFLFNLKDISAGFLECSIDAECIAENSKCTNNICECPKGEVFSSDGLKCLPIVVGMKAECTDDQQCAWLLGKHRCLRGKCSCDEGWRYFEGRCIKSADLFESCTTDIDCFNGYDLLAMKCNEGVCSCNEGYYLRGNYDCRPEAEVGDYCSLNSDCKTEGTVCSASLCINTALVEDYSEQNDKNILPPKVAMQGYDTSCATSTDCTVENSVCYALTNKCICKRGYFFKSEAEGCLAELGVESGCKSDADCPVTPGICISGKCYCRKTYFAAATNSACQKPMTHDNLFCNNVDRCYVLGKHAICEANKCKCPLNAEMDEEYICRLTDPNPGENCHTNPDLCSSLINSICIDSKCQCPDNYRLEEDTCLPNLGASCDDKTKLCQIENSVCSSNKICTCQQDYIQHDLNSTSTCLKLAAGLGGDCEINEQCSEVVTNSECSKDGCQCNVGYIEMDDICYQEKFIGDPCTNARHCSMLGSNVQCRKSICQCSADMKPTADMKDCEHSDAISVQQFHVGPLVFMICLLSFKLLIQN